MSTPTAVAFDSGRSSLFCALRAVGIGAGDEVLLQAYTCVAVPNAVVWCGARPRYVDIAPGSYNIDVTCLERRISKHTKAIIVQHTFGHPAPMKEIRRVAKYHGLYVIEDCAHALGATVDGRPAGTLGDIAIFSFGRDKVVSSVHGGVAITNDPDLGQKLRQIQAGLQSPSLAWIGQQLLHPVAFSLIVPLYYRFGLGKVLLVLLQRLRLLSLAVAPQERRGGRPSVHPSKFPNALARLALRQLDQLNQLNSHRRDICSIYSSALRDTGIGLPPLHDRGATFLRYTVQVPDPERVRLVARKHNIMLGDWYNVPIAPAGTDLQAVGYRLGECPVAEETARHSVNLPTHRKVDKSDAVFIAGLVRQEAKSDNGN